MSSVSLSRRRTVFGKFLVIPCCWSFHSVLLKSNIQFLFIISLYSSSVVFLTGLFNMFGNILLSLLFSVVLSSIKYIHSLHFSPPPSKDWYACTNCIFPTYNLVRSLTDQGIFAAPYSIKNSCCPPPESAKMLRSFVAALKIPYLFITPRFPSSPTSRIQIDQPLSAC